MYFRVSRYAAIALLAACVACSSKKADTEGTDKNGHVDAQIGQSNAEVPGAPSGSKREDLQKLTDLIVAEAADLPREEFEPAALAKKLGTDPRAHFEWVRDRTWWAPYRGLLRGSRGVMLDRIGSNLDRAVLLGDLLRHAGFKVRLAHAELSVERAQELLGKVRAIPDQRRSSLISKPVPAERQREIEATYPDIEKTLRQESTESKRLLDEGRSLARSQADLLYAAIKRAGLESPSEKQAAIAALRDYWWIEREDSGKWIAMDVLLPDSKEGGAAANPTATIEWKSNADAPSIPESDWHSVRIAVVLERLEEGKTAEQPALEVKLRPAEVLSKPISLIHLPRPWPDAVPDSKTDPNALGNIAVAVREWVPVLRVGKDTIVQSGFTDSGQPISDPLNSKRDISGVGAGGGFMSGFGDALSGGESATSSITAEWLEYEIQVPGLKTQRMRRPVFDLLGPVARKSLPDGFDASTNNLLVRRYEALLSRTDILLQPCDLTEEFITHLAASTVVDNQEMFRQLSREHDPAKSREIASTLLDEMNRWGPLPDLAIWRAGIAEQTGDGFIDRPNVLNYRVSLPVVNADQVGLRELIDVVSNSTGVRPGTSRDAFEIRVRQGVSDTVSEILALGGNLQSGENTASVFARSSPGPDGRILIRSNDKDSVIDLGWPDEVAARLTEEIESGYAAFAVKNPVEVDGLQRLAWWRIDPATGETIGVMDTGYHAASLTERAELEKTIESIRRYLSATGKAFRAAQKAGTATARDRQIRLLLARAARELAGLL